MSTASVVTFDQTIQVSQTCLCFQAQRAARALARRFDAAFKPLGLTNGQYSLMMVLNQPEPPPLGRVAEFLGMDRTSLTAMLKVLQWRGWVNVAPDPADRRSRRLSLTPDGMTVLAAALPLWQAEHDRLHADLKPVLPEPISDGLARLAAQNHQR